MPCGITLKCKKCGHKWEVWLGLNEEESAKEGAIHMLQSLEQDE